MKQRTKLALAAIITAAATSTVGAQTVPTPTETNFQVRTTGDLIRLCEASPTDPTGIAALHFCHGFAVGAYQYHQIAAAAEGKRRLICAPNPPPSRNEAIAAFVAWAKQNPNQMNTPPVEGMFRFLAQRYPCQG
ncbi:Rap1a/Tai family immunity protein [Azospirillum soli]|uniref:Rap1a/Tai family immunity protein n=1 Tax=Azospirillum soli TaxID=1304799 RepID=UPI001AE95DAF|nr:Rap1a/Tai family immunity protein [Azospirillum soli]MBP2311277.1 hypothetical protein [Azospirillum soli]